MPNYNAIGYICPPVFSAFNDVTVSTYSAEAGGLSLMAMRTSFTNVSVAWTANRLIFLPLLLPRPTLVDRFFWINSVNPAAGNTDVGVYTLDGLTKLVSCGSTANSGTATILQVGDATNTTLPANQWLWLALGCDSASQTYMSSQLPANGLDAMGVKEQLSGWSSGLPTTVTLGTPTVAVLPMFGFTGRSVI